MDIVELGALGELVGGVAVVASLVYVGYQVRQSTLQARLDASREVQGQWDDWPSWIVGNANVREAWEVAVGRDPDVLDLENPENLSGTALADFHLLMYRLANTMRSQYRMHVAGILGEAEVEHLRPLIRIYTASPAATDWWTRQAPALFDVGFVEFVRSASGGRNASRKESRVRGGRS